MDFVFYGTRIEREEDAGSSKRKAVAEASGQLRTLVPWRQEARDEQGRRRFHGAFTGGYSAGHYNTVGSREGWTPQSFTSSRNNRAEIRTQSVDCFLDDEERAEMEARSFAASNQFDTFGFTSAKQETRNRPSADEIVVPATESVGVRLLMKMGWRRGCSIALLALSGDDDGIKSSTRVYAINPKQDVHGLGYDPFKEAPEFREKEKKMLEPRRAAPGFGIGALEDIDVFTAGYDFEEFHAEEIEEPRPMIQNVRLLEYEKKRDVLPGFKAASTSDNQLQRLRPPVIPKEFSPNHRFAGPVGAAGNQWGEVAPPGDSCLRLAIEGMATLVARCGTLFEDLSRQKNQSNPLFSFLFGGSGQDYYARKLWEGRKKHDDKQWQWKGQNPENRGRILGEKPLERSLKHSATSSVNNATLQFNLSDTFTTPVPSTGPAEVLKPFPEKQERYEQFLKEKHHGGLRTRSDTSRARERLEFDAIEKGSWRKESKQAIEVSEGELVKYPKREDFEWRPSSPLCKLFKLTDPYLGKLPPPPRRRSKMDALIVMPKHPVMSDNKDVVDEEVMVVERPVDLYKAIFSDDSGDDDQDAMEEPVASRTLNRLIAGDFLESLGIELGLEIPPDAPHSESRNADKGDYSEDQRSERKRSRHKRLRSYSD